MKPNNLFLSSSGTLKLGDFGLARIYGSPNPRLTHEVSRVTVVTVTIRTVTTQSGTIRTVTSV